MIAKASQSVTPHSRSPMPVKSFNLEKQNKGRMQKEKTGTVVVGKKTKYVERSPKDGVGVGGRETYRKQKRKSNPPSASSPSHILRIRKSVESESCDRALPPELSSVRRSYAPRCQKFHFLNPSPPIPFSISQDTRPFLFFFLRICVREMGCVFSSISISSRLAVLRLGERFTSISPQPTFSTHCW